MSGPQFLENLKQKFGDKVTGANLENIDPWIEIAPDGLVEVCRFLKTDPDGQFDLLNCISGVDYFQPDPAKAKKADFEPHVEVVYHLSSTVKKHTLVIKVMLPRWEDDTEGQPPQLDSVTSVWRTADWHEREVFDLSGVWFRNHPDLKRILLPEDWDGFPLRKDYEMPLEYHGMRGR
jgi:NADH-quinone oxidoreductase subunit C